MDENEPNPERRLSVVSCAGCGDPEPTVTVQTRFGPSLRCDNCQADAEGVAPSWHEVSAEWKPLSKKFRCAAKDLQAAVQHGLVESPEMVKLVEGLLDTMRNQPGRQPQTIELDDFAKTRIWNLRQEGLTLAKIAETVNPTGLTAIQIKAVIQRIEADQYFAKVPAANADLKSINPTNKG